jgi:hypothetical protein
MWSSAIRCESLEKKVAVLDGKSSTRFVVVKIDK